MQQAIKFILLIILVLQQLSLYGQENSFFSDSINAVVLNRKANELGRNGMNVQALDTFFASLNLRKKIYGEKSANLAPSYSGIGITYQKLGQNDLALRYFTLAEQNYSLKQSKEQDPRVNLYVNIGNVYRSKLDFIEAMRYYEQALYLYLKQDEILPERIATINYNISEILYLTYKYEEALELIHDNINNSYAEDKILYLELIAFIYQLKGDISTARINYQKAIELTILINGKDHINIAYRYINYAFFLISANLFPEALDVLEDAYEIIKLTQSEHGLALAEYYRVLGYLSANYPIETTNMFSFKKQKRENLNAAINHYKNGLWALKFPVNKNLNNIEDLGKLLSLMNCIDLLKIMADAYNELANLERSDDNPLFSKPLSLSIETYKIVGSLIQRARKEISNDESKIQLTELEYSTLNKLIQTAYTAYSLTKNQEYLNLAFQGAERLKSSSVFDKVSDMLALENSLIPDSLIQLEKKLNNTILILSEKIYDENNKEQPDSLFIKDFNQKIFAATKQREELNRYMETEFSDYYELKYSKSMLSIYEVKERLSKNQVLVEYVLNESDSATQLFTFIVSGSTIEMKRQVVSDNFSESIETMFQFMSNPNFMFTKNNDSKAFCLSAYQLYSQLIEPLQEHIVGKNIIIVPDGKLSYIPFDGLIKSLPDTTKQIEFNQLSYLIKSHNINYSNSANLLFKKNKFATKNNIRTLAFAPTYNAERFEMLNQNYTLVPLPGIHEEVGKIAKTVKTKIFEGEHATERNFRENAENFDILHLAMHAFINDSMPAFSRLAFSQNTFSDANSDGWINTADIYNLNLNARLTVLSACNTGTGKLKKGEGIMSLARGFLYAGCPSIIMSLWEVEDKSGTEIMGLFYKNLKKGKNKDEALRLAKLEYLENSNNRRAHPHYWLGFVSIGDNSALFRSYDLYFYILLVLVLSVIGADQFLRMRKAPKKRAF